MNTIDKKEWKKVMFGDVCSNLNVAIQDPDAMGIDRYVGLEHIETGNLHINSWGNIAEGTTFTKTFKPGHVLFGKRRAYLKKAAVADFKGLCSSDILVFEANEKMIEQGLLPFLVSSDRFFEYAVQTSAGSLSPRTKFQDLAKFEFLLPPKNQQTKLAELLWAADEVVENYESLSVKLFSVKTELMQSSFAKRENSKLIKEIAKVTSGGTPDRKMPIYWNGNIPWITTSEINYLDINDTVEKITQQGVDNSSAKLIPSNSLLMAMYGQGVTRGRVARLMIDSTMNQACAAIILNDKEDLDYLYYFLQHSYFEIRDLAQGANQQNLNGEIVKNISVPYPNKDIRINIAKKLSNIDSTISKKLRDDSLYSTNPKAINQSNI